MTIAEEGIMKFLRTPLIPALVTLLLSAGCGGSGDREARNAPADSTALAAALLTPETFDTIQWPSDSAALARGAVVWSYSCRKCHGDWGAGDGGFVQRGDTVRPPSFLAPDWQYATDRHGMRERVFTGTNDGMPHWGMVGLKPRDVDAVTLYIQRGLRGG
jgi:mono/diheme cytochrome c family protein